MNKQEEQAKIWAVLRDSDTNNNIWTPQQVLAELRKRHLQRASEHITTQVINQDS